ncbi:MAG: polyribonucleotide nucleotidyltransferase [Oscillospiraceae bacterium]|nr:polyribonucleotide nucleotidyltransferase [Oscillospiraceae bacterium]
MKEMVFSKYKVYETEFAGRKLVVETGKMAGLANGSCLVRYGETAVLVTATASEKPRAGIDFFPLAVDFEERLYAVGRIPGSFMRREGRPSERAILTSRLIDRPIRPLFPKDLRNDVAVSITVLSVDNDCAPEIAGMIGTSIALSISDIPWNGPIAGVSIGCVDGKFVVNPTSAEREKSTLNLTVAGSAQKVVMIEAGADQIADDAMFDAIMLAHEEIKKVVEFISGIQAEIGLPKFEYEHVPFNDELFKELKANILDRVRAGMDTDDKTVRDKRFKVLSDELIAEYSEKYPDIEQFLGECIYKLQKIVVRQWLLEGKRVDGRALDEVRPLAAEVGVLPRTHGSGMFTRGQTQVLTVATLGTIADQQKLDTIYEEEFKRYIHHYNFPSYSVGEARPSRGPGRREIGHGALAERALEPVIPSEEEFPYSIRLVSEVLSSNGSTSQGSICGSTLALMDAGVPIKAPVAGISCGLVTDEDKWLTFIDIQGVEDFYGDMDFKVAGTKTGITAIQMDLKIDGLTPEIIRSALTITRDARYRILDEIMLPCIPTPRDELSKYAPKMLHMTIDPEKIRDVIGKGGSVIQKIVADTGAKIDIEDDGNVYISAIDGEACKAAKKVIETIVLDPVVGELYYGKVVRIIPIGAFVEIAPGKDGMVHISKLENRRVEKVEDILSVGDMTWVKFMGIDDKGRTNFSRKDAYAELAKREAEEKKDEE